MESKRALLPLIGSIIIAAGLIIAAVIFAVAAGKVAERPIMGSMSGTLSSGSLYPSQSMDLMTSRELQDYLEIRTDVRPYMDDDENDLRARAGMEANITSGKWPGFPYVMLGGKLYFSKSAVDEWFTENAKNQLVID